MIIVDIMTAIMSKLLSFNMKGYIQEDIWSFLYLFQFVLQFFDPSFYVSQLLNKPKKGYHKLNFIFDL